MSDVRVVAGAVCVALVVGFLAGGEVASRMYEKKAAVAMATQGAKDYERLRKAVEVQDGLRGDLERARAEYDRVRHTLDSARASRPAGEHDGTGASGCEKLLAESLELLGECRERYLSCAGKHDAITEIVK